MFGQPLRKLGGEVSPCASSQVVSEARKGCSYRPLRFVERVKLGSAANPVYKLLVLHALIPF